MTEARAGREGAVVVRVATLADRTALGQLARETYAVAFGASMSAADLAAHLELHLSDARVCEWLGRDLVLVAERDGVAVGFAQCGAMREPHRGAVVELRRLYVRASEQARGIGSRLLETVLAQPFVAAADAVELDVWEANRRAQRFYARFGFTIVGSRQFAVASGADTTPDLIMRRRRADIGSR